MDVDMAIRTKFVGSSLQTMLTGGLHKGSAPQGTASPYGIFFLVTGRPDYNFSHVHESQLWQFSLFSDKASSADIEEIFDRLIELYDVCSLTINGYEHYSMMRETYRLLPRDADGFWQYIVEYRVMMERIRSDTTIESRSMSPSRSPSASISPSLSPSASPSESPSVSPSASPST